MNSLRLFLLTISLFLGQAFAQPTSEIQGALASKLFVVLNSEEGDCGAGHCWAGGSISCQMTNATKRTVCKKEGTEDNSKSINGTLAHQLFNLLQGEDCGTGHCWSKGNVSCQMTNATKKVVCTVDHNEVAKNSVKSNREVSSEKAPATSK